MSNVTAGCDFSVTESGRVSTCTGREVTIKHISYFTMNISNGFRRVTHRIYIYKTRSTK